MSQGAYIGVNGVARKIKSGYIGVNTAVPTYETSTPATVTASNVSTYFTVNNSSYYFSGSGGEFVSNNGYEDDTTAESTWTAKNDMNISFTYYYSSEKNYDKFTLIVGSTTVVNEASGGPTTSTYSGTLKAGDKITLRYKKDSSQNSGDDLAKIHNISVTTIVQTGTTNKAVARKIKKAYIGVDGVARLVFSSGNIKWRKWSCTEYIDTEYIEVDSNGSDSIGDTFTFTYDVDDTFVWDTYGDYTFSSVGGYYGIGDREIATPDTIVGRYSIIDTEVRQFINCEHAGGSQYTLTWEYVGLAVEEEIERRFVKGNTDYGIVYAEEGELPETGSLVEGSATGSYCIVRVNGTYYYYEKIEEE